MRDGHRLARLPRDAGDCRCRNEPASQFTRSIVTAGRSFAHHASA